VCPWIRCRWRAAILRREVSVRSRPAPPTAARARAAGSGKARAMPDAVR